MKKQRSPLCLNKWNNRIQCDSELCPCRDNISTQIHYLWSQKAQSGHYATIYIMNYTIKIDHKEKDAVKIIQMIKELAGDSPYVGIYEDETGLSDELVQELDRRYKQVLKNPKEGKSWEGVKTGLLMP